jgi:phosphohistidine phosphatase SixA
LGPGERGLEQAGIPDARHTAEPLDLPPVQGQQILHVQVIRARHGDSYLLSAS